MKLIWHMVKKDIARDRWALLAWALLFVGQFGLGITARHSDGSDPRWVAQLQMGAAGLVFAQMIMGYVLVARLVHADALVGTAMFWPTRPIAPARLFAAKALGALLIFGLLPVVLLLPWWLYCDFGWREILWTAIETFGWQLLMIAPALLVASLTDDLGRVLLWTLLLVIGGLSWIVLLQASLVSAWGRAVGQVGTPLMFTRLWMSALVFVAGGFLIGAHQFLTRRFARSVGLVVLCLGLVAAVGQAWPWNLTGFIAEWHRPPLPPMAPGLVEGLTFTVLPAKGVFGRGDLKLKHDSNPKDATLNLRLQVQGLPADMTIAAESKPMAWTWPDGMKLAREDFYQPHNDPAEVLLRRTYSLPVPAADPETVRWEKARMDKIDANLRAQGLQPLQWRDPQAPVPPGVMMTGYTTLPNSFLARMRAEPPAWVSNLRCILYRPEVIIDLPLQPDARASTPGRTFRLRQLNLDKPVLLVTTRSSVAAMGLWFSALMRGEFRNWLFRDRIVSVNHDTGDIGWVGENQAGSRSLQVAGVTVDWNLLHVQPRLVIRDGKSVVSDPQWLEHSTLVFLTDEEVARFDREVKADKFALEPEVKD